MIMLKRRPRRHLPVNGALVLARKTSRGRRTRNQLTRSLLLRGPGFSFSRGQAHGTALADRRQTRLLRLLRPSLVQPAPRHPSTAVLTVSVRPRPHSSEVLANRPRQQQ